MNSHHPVWDDDDEDMPISQGRKTRIGELLSAVAAMRPCRRHGDPALLTELQTELRVLLDANITQKAGRPS